MDQKEHVHCKQTFVLPFIQLLWPKILSGVLIVWTLKSYKCIIVHFILLLYSLIKLIEWTWKNLFLQCWILNCSIFMTHYKRFGLYASCISRVFTTKYHKIKTIINWWNRKYTIQSQKGTFAHLANVNSNQPILSSKKSSAVQSV